MEGLREDVKYLKIAGCRGNNLINTSQNLGQFQQKQQEQPIQNSNEEVFLQEPGSGDIQDEAVIPTVPNCDKMLMKIIPQRIEDAIQLIKQFTSNSYQQFIVQQVLQVTLFRFGGPDTKPVNSNVLNILEKCWASIKFVEECQSEDANRYSSIRQNIQTYFPDRQIFNHISAENPANFPDVQIKKFQQQIDSIQKELDKLYDESEIIIKPLIKINQLRKYLIKFEPIRPYSAFINAHSMNDPTTSQRYLQKIEVEQDYKNVLQKYDNLMVAFKKLEEEAYQGKKKARLFEMNN